MSNDTSCFATYKMGTIKQINVKNRAYCFYNEKIDLENFESNVIKIEKII